MTHFRFEDLEIWQLAKELAIKFHKVADNLEKRKFFRYAEQLRGAGLSLPNNVAEGSGSIHPREFEQFLNIAKRSVFEDASMILVFHELNLIKENEKNDLLEECDKLSRKITSYCRARNNKR